MAFLAPLFFLGLATLAIPVLIHLTQREKKMVQQFPSLMFVRRIPYQTVRRRKLRDLALLCVRLAALMLIVAAFAPAVSLAAERGHGYWCNRTRSRRVARPELQHGVLGSMGPRQGRGA
jgi:hypothetical protein